MKTTNSKTHAKPCPESNLITVPSREERLGRDLTTILDDAESSAKLLLSLAELLEGNPPLARLALLAHHQAARSADLVGEMLGLEVDVC